MPAPMTAPIASMIRSPAPSTRLREFGSSAAASSAIGVRANTDMCLEASVPGPGRVGGGSGIGEHGEASHEVLVADRDETARLGIALLHQPARLGVAFLHQSSCLCVPFFDLGELLRHHILELPH